MLKRSPRQLGLFMSYSYCNNYSLCTKSCTHHISDWLRSVRFNRNRKTWHFSSNLLET